MAGLVNPSITDGHELCPALATVNNASVNLHGMVSGEHVLLILWPQTRVDVTDFLSEYFLR